MSKNLYNKFMDIERVSYKFMVDAKHFHNAHRGSGNGDSYEDMYGKWSDDYRTIQYNRPFFRTIEGKNSTAFVLDIDVDFLDEEFVRKYYTEMEMREIRIKASSLFFEQWLNKHPDYKFFVYLSGNGIYLIQNYDVPISKTKFINVLWGDNGILDKCSSEFTDTPHTQAHLSCDGWHFIGSDFIRIIKYNGVEIEIKIDARMMHSGGRLFRMPYSPYYKMREIVYCVPMVYNSDGSWNINKVISNSFLYNVDVVDYEIPLFQFDTLLGSIDSVKSNTSKVSRNTYNGVIVDTNYTVNVPEPDDVLTDKQVEFLDKMYANLTGDVDITPPCVKTSLLNPHDRHFSRFVVVRYLSNKYNLSPDEVALFIRFKLNNEHDNIPQNKHNLHIYIPLIYGDKSNPNLPPGCNILQDKTSSFYSCDVDARRICGRTYCLSNQPKIESNEDEEDEDSIQVTNTEIFGAMGDKIRTMLERDNINYEIIKTTRAGVTTTMIKESVEMGKKVLVISPTNAIGEKTFKDAMEIIHNNGIDVKGAVLSSNSKSCLKLVQQRDYLENYKQLHNDWGESGVAYNKMSFHFKNSCIGDDYICEYFDHTFDFPVYDDSGMIPIPLVRSDTNNDLCAYQSIVQNMDDLDVLFITYDKLQSIALSGNTELEYDLHRNFDVVFMDEISQFAQKNNASVPIYRYMVDSEDDDEGSYYSFFDNLDDDVSKLLSKKRPSEFINNFVAIIENFSHIYRDLIIDYELTGKFDDMQSFIEYLDNPLSQDDLLFMTEKFSSIWSVITTIAVKENIHLKHLEQAVLLLSNERWWIQNIPTIDKPINLSIIAAPVVDYVRTFVSRFHRANHKQVIVTDATMPLIKMSDLLNIPFNRYVIGDPRRTTDYQIVVADNRTVYSDRFFKSGRRKVMKDIMKVIENVCSFHGANNVMVVAPNKRIYQFIRNTVRKRKNDFLGLEITYYRSDKTVGVASDKRVMITMCSPIPPKNSYMWLASYYHQIGLYQNVSIDELSHSLEQMNAHQTYYQTIGRAKSPDNSSRSIVYSWGMDGNSVNTIIQMDEDVPIPNITTMSISAGRFKVLMDITYFWMTYGLIVSSTLIRVMKYLQKNKSKKVSFYQLRRNLRLTKRDIVIMGGIDQRIADYYNLKQFVNKKGTVYLYIE